MSTIASSTKGEVGHCQHGPDDQSLRIVASSSILQHCAHKLVFLSHFSKPILKNSVITMKRTNLESPDLAHRWLITPEGTARDGEEQVMGRSKLLEVLGGGLSPPAVPSQAWLKWRMPAGTTL